MKKHRALASIGKDSVKKYYILTRPARLSELTFDEMEDEGAEAGWREKSRQLQARRWRKIRHQLA